MDEELKSKDGSFRTIKVIPNERLTDIPVFYKETNEYFHAKLIRDFSRETGLNYTDINGLIKDGFILIVTITNLKDSGNKIKNYCCYLPDKISEKQYEQLLGEYNTILEYLTFGFDIANSEGEPIKEDGIPSEIIDYFYDVAEDCVESRGLK